MSKIGIITNPHSKLNKRNPRRSALLSYILGERGQLEVTNTLEDLSRVATEFHQKGIRVLAIAGGDGTISRTITALIGEYRGDALPQIAILGGGTINVLYNNLKIKGSPEQILYRLTQKHSALERLPTRRIPSICVEDHFGFLFADGLAANFLREYYKRKSGPLGALFWCLRIWAAYFYGGKLYQSVVHDQDTTLTLEHGSIEHINVSTFCSTVPQMPLGYPLFTRLLEYPGSMQCVSFTFPAARAVLRLPVLLLRKADSTTRDKFSFLTEKIDITHPKPFEYTLDGELFTSKAQTTTLKKGPEIDFVIA